MSQSMGVPDTYTLTASDAAYLNEIAASFERVVIKPRNGSAHAAQVAADGMRLFRQKAARCRLIALGILRLPHVMGPATPAGTPKGAG